ncbi:hypothetical protein WBG99_21165 [Streptomyces sp. TG1A-60]
MPRPPGSSPVLISRSHLNHLFQTEGLRVATYVREQRLRHA